MSANIVQLSDYRPASDCRPADDQLDIDLATAVDVAIRDLREIRQAWGSPAAYARVSECEAVLTKALASN